MGDEQLDRWQWYELIRKVLFSDLSLRGKKSITKSYLGYIKFEILINSSKDVKRQINNYLNLKFSDHGQK